MASEARLYGLAKRAGFTDAQARVMARIGMAESSGRRRAINSYIGADGVRHYVYGFWQVSDIHGFPASLLYDPMGNAKAARQVFIDSGHFGPWSVCNDDVCSNMGGSAEILGGGGFGIGATWGTGPSGSGFEAGKKGLQAAGEAGGKILDVAGTLQAIIDAITDPQNWWRVALFVLGLLLGIAGIIALGGNVG